MRVYLVIIFLMGAVGVYAQHTERGHVTFAAEETYQEAREAVEQLGGKIMVYWPGGAWVRWNKDNTQTKDLGLVTEVIGYTEYREWAGIMPEMKEQALDCGTAENEALYLHKQNKGTSDTMNGHSVCAIMLVNQQGGPNPWNLTEQNEVMINTAVNLAWWSEQAWLYGVEASFEVIPYYFDDPICQVSEDPTIASNNIWRTEIMTKAGYPGGSNMERETAFVQDMIAEKESEWGFIAYIIRGATNYRSNAFLFGPSTTCVVNVVRSSYTFAHEVGHIYGLLDEYEERAINTYDFELNGLANLNADFRNIINAPCLMKLSSSPMGLCCYNPVHLHWTDEVREFEVITEPEDGMFTVQYLNTVTNQPIQTRIYQGNTRLPMGFGTKFRLGGTDEIKVASGTYHSPMWQESGESALLIEMDNTTLPEAHINYVYQEESSQFTTHLAQGLYYSGRRVNEIDHHDGAVLSVTTQGVSIYDDGEYRLFDFENEVRPGEFIETFRSGWSLTKLADGEWLVGSQLGASRPEIMRLDRFGEIETWAPPTSFRQIGAYAAVALAPGGQVLGAFEEGDVHRYSPDGTFDILGRNQGLPAVNVTAMATDPAGNVWLGYDGGRTGEGFTGLFLLNTSDWSFGENMLVPEEVRGSAITKIEFFDAGETILIVSGDRIYVKEFGNWNSYFPVSGNVLNAERLSPGRWILAGTEGISYMDEDLDMVVINQESHQLQENLIRTVSYMPGGVILAGHVNYGISAVLLGDELTVYAEGVKVPENSFHIYPNPVIQDELFVKSELALGVSQLILLDLNGRVVFSQNVDMEEQGTVRLDLPSGLRSGLYLLTVTGKVNGTLGLIQVVK